MTTIQATTTGDVVLHITFTFDEQNKLITLTATEEGSTTTYDGKLEFKDHDTGFVIFCVDPGPPMMTHSGSCSRITAKKG